MGRVQELENGQAVLRNSAIAAEPATGVDRLHTRTPLLETGFILSVVVATCDRMPQLRWCLETLEAAYVASRERLPQVEVLVCDDGGSDGSFEYVSTRQWSMSVKYIYQQNEQFGAGSNRNQGIVQAKGKYLLLLDSDCAVGAGLPRGGTDGARVQTLGHPVPRKALFAAGHRVHAGPRRTRL